MSESPLEETTTYLSTVIDLAEVRIARGETSAKERVCEHRNILYSTNERKIWCKDCKRTIDGFDGFLIFARNFTAMMADAEHKVSEANAALAHAARLRATKQLDRIWSGRVMAVACPHCNDGLLPEDFANGAQSAWSRELEMARRKKNASAPVEAAEATLHAAELDVMGLTRDEALEEAATIVSSFSTERTYLPEGVDGGWLAIRDMDMAARIRALKSASSKNGEKE